MFLYLHVEGSEALTPSLYVSKHHFLFLVGTVVQKFLSLWGFRVHLSVLEKQDMFHTQQP